MNTHIRRSERLLILANRVFGEGVIQDAFISTWGDDEGTSQTRGDIELDFSRAESILKDDGTSIIDYSGLEIVFEFHNGRRVVFGNSEWATINPLSDVIQGKIIEDAGETKDFNELLNESVSGAS